MTSTAQELWNDHIFVTKRLIEQNDYMHNVTQRFFKGEIDLDRYELLRDSSFVVYNRFKNRLSELMKWSRSSIGGAQV